MAGKHCYSNSAGMFIFAFYPGRELYHSCVFLDYTYCNVFIYTSKKYHKKIALHWLSPQNIQTKKGMDKCYFLIHLVFQLYIRYYCEMGKVKIPFGFLSRNLKFQPKKKKAPFRFSIKNLKSWGHHSIPNLHADFQNETMFQYIYILKYD